MKINSSSKFFAELIGTFGLVLFGCGAAAIAGTGHCTVQGSDCTTADSWVCAGRDSRELSAWWLRHHLWRRVADHRLGVANTTGAGGIHSEKKV